MLFSNIRDDDGWLLGAGAAEDDLVGRDPLTVLTSEKTLLMAWLDNLLIKFSSDVFQLRCK